MNAMISSLCMELDTVDSTQQFKGWVRKSLRMQIPHATFLATMGRLYGLGSVPTHRVDVDFPLSIIEELKNSAGALDDPLMYGWFKTEKIRFLDMSDASNSCYHGIWRRTLVGYGIRGMLIHGVLDHKRRRFVVFEVGNPFKGNVLELARIFATLTPLMADKLWSLVELRDVRSATRLVGHPTGFLTTTELQIVQLIAQGLSNKEIARKRGVSDSTVKTQLQRTGAKLGATRRAEIVALAMPLLSALPPQTLLDYGDELY